MGQTTETRASKTASRSMRSLIRSCAVVVLAIVAFIGAAPAAEAAEVSTPSSVTLAVDCSTKSPINLSKSADEFISLCRKASIRREFPGQHLGDSVKDISNGKSATQKKAWKLLNDGRFKK